MALAILYPTESSAQLNLAATSTAYTINFSGTLAGVQNGAYTGAGFQPTPAAGQLDSDAWAVTGWSDGVLLFGGTRVTASTDYTRGTSATAVTTAGFYNFSASPITAPSLGIQPGGGDWAPGTLTLRVQNTTGSTLTSIDVAYKLYVRNDQGRSNSFNFSYSTDDVTYTPVGALDYASPEASDVLGFVLNNRSTTVTSLSIPNNGFFYIRWSGADISGSGSRDEFALDDISVTGYAGAPTPSLSATALPAFGAQCINAGPYGPNSFTINGSNLTTADVTVGALAGFTYSTTAGGTYTATLSLPQPGGAYSQQIFVRFTPTAVQSYSGNIPVGGGGATGINVAASGSGVNTPPTAVSGTASLITPTSAVVSGQITANGCTPVTAYGIEYSTVNGFANGSGTQVASANLSGTNYSSALTGLSPCTIYYFKAYATNAGGTAYGTQGTFTTSLIAAPVATAATAVGATGFTANWNTVTGATQYRLDVYTQTPSFTDDFTDGNFTSAPAWVGDAASFSILTNATLPGGLAATDGSYLGTNNNVATSALMMPSNAVFEWKFSLGSPDYDPSSTNHFGVILMSNTSVTDVNAAFNGYYIRIGTTGSTDRIELWRSTGLTKTQVGMFASSPDLDPGALRDGLDLRITRNGSGQFQLFYATGFTYATTPTTSGGTLTDATYNTSNFFGPYVSFANPSTIRRVYIDNIDLGAAINYVAGYNNFNAGLATSATLTGLTQGTTYYYVVRAVGPSCTSANSNVISVTTNAVPIYYSRLTGNVTDPIWSNTPTGVAGPAVWNPNSSMVVQSGHVVTNTGNVSLNNLTVDPGGTLVLNGFATMSTYGNGTINGTLTANDNSTLAFVGPVGKTLSSAAALDLFNMTVNAPGNMSTGATINIRGTLLLEDGNFDVSGGEVILTSDATRTGRLGPVGAGASYTGSTFTVQRYIPAGITNWRLLSSAVSPLQLYQWRTDFYTAGFPGSHWPTFDQPVGSNILWPSIRSYDETNAGTNALDGLIGPTDISDQIQVGRGYAAWCGDNLNNTTDFIVDVKRFPNIANPPIALPVTWTNTGTPMVDGWNLVGNPVASPIDFSLLSRGADISSTFHIYDPVAGNNAVWDENTSIGTGSMNGNIQSSQGFWVKANGPANAVTVSESAKVNDPNGGSPFGGLQQINAPVMKLKMHSQLNQFSDEVILHFGVGAAGLDGNDVDKFIFAHPEAPQVITTSSDGDDLVLNAWGEVINAAVIPVKVDAAVTGAYTLEVSAWTAMMDDYCVVLEDQTTNTFTPLVVGTQYTFTMGANDPVGPARFLLHVTGLTHTTITPTDTLVAVNDDIVFNNDAPASADLLWDFGDGTTSTDDVPVHAYSAPGTYTVTLTTGIDGCTTVTHVDIVVNMSTGITGTGAQQGIQVRMVGDLLQITWALENTGLSLDILDATGRVIASKGGLGRTGTTGFTTTNWSEGLYFVRMTDGTMQQQRKIAVGH